MTGGYQGNERDSQEGKRNMYWINDVNMWYGSKWRKEPKKYSP